MTRKDTILIAVVINAGLLAILFTTAVIYDTDKAIAPIELSSPLAAGKPAQADPAQNIVAVAAATGDEVDNVLKYYAASPSSQPFVVETQPETYAPEPIAIQSNAPDEEDFSAKEREAAQGNYVEVTVKKGDVLEKIARANKSSVGAIKRANKLQDEALSIGQVLKIPVKQNSLASAAPIIKPEATAESRQDLKKESEPEKTEAVYHIVKSGDNPWKIAKQYNVKYEDILRLNRLDEEKARNLKIGDRIRVK